MNPHLSEATASDCALLVGLMSEFYAESGYPLNPAQSLYRQVASFSR
jgi:hypothetical protein